jgi:hypothetical protein
MRQLPRRRDEAKAEKSFQAPALAWGRRRYAFEVKESHRMEEVIPEPDIAPDFRVLTPFGRRSAGANDAFRGPWEVPVKLSRAIHWLSDKE